MMCRAPGPQARGRLSLPARAALMYIWTALGAGCASNSGLTGLPAASESTGLSVDDLTIVDCLIPGIPRRIGNTVFITGRRVLKVTAHECALYAGEYVLRGSRDTALEKWLPDAQAGDPKAQVYVGEIYQRGLGTEPDYARAAEWYRKAAEQGEPRAQASLSVLYEKGLGVPKDSAMALEWKRRAAGPITPVSLSPEVSAELRAVREQLEQRSEQFKRSEAESARTKQELDETKAQLARLQSGAGTMNAPRVRRPAGEDQPDTGGVGSTRRPDRRPEQRDLRAQKAATGQAGGCLRQRPEPLWPIPRAGHRHQRLPGATGPTEDSAP